jgi:Flp pilus assembly protein TadD
MNDDHWRIRRYGTGALLGAVLLAACSLTTVHEGRIPPLKGQPEVAVADVDPLWLPTDGRSFVRQYAGPEVAAGNRAWSLAYAALDPYLLNFDYDPLRTATAEEAYRDRAGNCLSFSNLFVAMAREAGLDAWYQEVAVFPEWSSVNDTMFVSKHVNAVVAERGREYTVDVSRRRNRGGERTRKLSDAEAKAQYFNNLGAQALVDDDLALAHAYFRKALETQSGLAYVWSNLGVVLRRNGQVDDARGVYQTALQLDPQQSVALNNLYLIHTETGDEAAAEAIRRRVERNRRRNPYYLNHLAEVALEEQRYTDAIGLARRAIRIDGSEYRFHFTLARSQFLAGQPEVARASLGRARELAPRTPGGLELALPDGSL